MNPVIAALIAGAVCLVLGVGVGMILRKMLAESKIGTAEKQAERVREEAEKLRERAKDMVAEGRKQAETLKKEAVLAAQEEGLKLKNEMELEIRDRRAEVSRTEAKLSKREETLDKKSDLLDKKSEQLDKKNEQLDRKIKDVDAIREKAEGVLTQQMARLEEISGYTAEQAKAELLANMESEVKHEMAQRLVELESRFKDEADDRACHIMALAIQRCAGDFVAESTISSVALPSEEMKGRIIGREGRNIQKLETLTGVELIIDDTPEVITISGFDPIRREVARLALEKLIADGRIHPTRIEEMVEKAKKDVDAAIKQAGERATFEVNIHGINPDLVRLL